MYFASDTSCKHTAPAPCEPTSNENRPKSEDRDRIRPWSNFFHYICFATLFRILHILRGILYWDSNNVRRPQWCTLQLSYLIFRSSKLDTPKMRRQSDISSAIQHTLMTDMIYFKSRASETISCDKVIPSLEKESKCDRIASEF
jgi:hypothetical protein